MLKTRSFCIALLMLGAFSALPSTAQSASYSQLIVAVDRDTPLSPTATRVENAGARITQVLKAAHSFTVKPLRSVGLTALQKKLSRLKGVRYVEPDFVIGKSKMPNDPLFSQQYQHFQATDEDIDSTAAWDQRTSCSKVAILDSGVQIDHPDLQGKIWKNSKETPGNDSDDDKNGYIDDYYGVDLISDRGSGQDKNGHGTHVAGIIGGRGNNGTGIAGVCWSATLMPLKFLGANGQGFTSNGIEGIDYAIAKGAKIVNCSFSSDSKSTAFEEAIERAKDSGVLLVVAAGNDGKNIDQHPSYPASFTQSNILTVGASDSSDRLASYSNYGKSGVDLLAPGDNIVSTYLHSSYSKLSGTSMAAPMVSAVAAMLRAKDSSATYSTIRKTIRGTVDKIQAASGRTYSGGRLNDLQALNKL